jgi:hypothetical protein
VDEHNAYISQLPDTDTGTITNNHNNIDRHDAGAGLVADRVGAAVAAHLGPLLRGLDARLDTLNRLAARLLIQAQQAGTAGNASVGTGTVRAAGTPRHLGVGTQGNGTGVTGPNGAGGSRQDGAQQYEYVGGPAEAGLRREISRYCAEVDRVHFGGVPGKANKAIFCTFGFKSRSQMGLEELGEVLAWAREEWPLS